MDLRFDALANEYDKWFAENHHLFDAEVEAVASVMEAGVKYVEIGVGTGIFAARLGIGEGVEPTDGMAEFAAARGIAVRKGAAEALPYADGSVEGLVSITVDCFLSDIRLAYAEAYRVLKTGGSFVVAFLDAATPLGKQYEAFKENSDYYRGATFHTAAEIRALLEGAGFVCVEARQTVFTLDNVPQTVKNGHGEGVFAVIQAKK